MAEKEYAGFWIRTGAAIIDSLLVLIIIVPILSAIYGVEYWFSDSLVKGFWDVMFNYVLPAVAIVIFWTYKSATPGKMALKLTIVDVDTGGKPSTRQFIIRYLGYYVSTIPLFLGIIWVGIDRRKQGWHDKLAGTVVIRYTMPEPVQFREPLEENSCKPIRPGNPHWTEEIRNKIVPASLLDSPYQVVS